MQPANAYTDGSSTSGASSGDDENLSSPRMGRNSSDCVYSNVISSFVSGGVQKSIDPGTQSRGSSQLGSNSKESNMNVRDSDPLRSVIAERIATLERNRSNSSEATARELSRLTTQQLEIEKRRDTLAAKTTLTESEQSHLVALNQSLIEVNYSKNIVNERARLDELFHQRQVSAVSSQDKIHPVLQSLYSHQNAIAGNESLRPLARELVSYAGLTVGGPAGLVIGSILGTFLGGRIDRMAQTMAKNATEANSKIEDMTISLQEVCKWQSITSQLRTALFDEKTIALRRRNQEKLLEQIRRAQNETCACDTNLPELQKQVASLGNLLEIIKNRIGNKKFGIRDEFEKSPGFADLIKNVPQAVLNRLRKNEATSVEQVYSELVTEKLNLAGLMENAKPENIESNRQFLNRLKQMVEETMGDPTPAEKENMRMILASADSQLKIAEIALQSRARTVIENSYTAQKAKLIETYKANSAFLEVSIAELNINYMETLEAVNNRARALEESARANLLEVRNREREVRERFLKSNEDNPLGSVSAPNQNEKLNPTKECGFICRIFK